MGFAAAPSVLASVINSCLPFILLGPATTKNQKLTPTHRDLNSTLARTQPHLHKLSNTLSARQPRRRSQPISLADHIADRSERSSKQPRCTLALNNNNRCNSPSLALQYPRDSPRCLSASFFSRTAAVGQTVPSLSHPSPLLPFRSDPRKPDRRHGCCRNPQARLQPRRRLRQPVGHCEYTHTT